MPKTRSIKEILDDMRCRGDYVLTHFADELEEAINSEFAEFAGELKAQFSLLLKDKEEE